MHRSPLVEFLRYFGCSALALAVDAGLYAGLIRLAGWGYAAAAAMGFVAGLSVVYLLSIRLVFRTRRLDDLRSEFTVFAGIGVLGLLLTEVLLWFLVEMLRADPVAARLVTAAAVFFANFALRKLLLFSKPVRKGGWRD